MGYPSEVLIWEFPNQFKSSRSRSACGTPVVGGVQFGRSGRNQSDPTSGPTRLAVLLPLAVLFSLVRSASAYSVNCDPNSSNITSVLGETRPSSLYPPGRFHTGVDLAGCTDGESVTAIKAGTADYVPECATPNDCRRLVASDGSVFDYIHIRNAVAIGSNVALGSQVGLVDGDHLHLAQVQRVGTFAINPQFVGQLDFNRSVDALATFKQITVGAVTDSVIRRKRSIKISFRTKLRRHSSK